MYHGLGSGLPLFQLSYQHLKHYLCQFITLFEVCAVDKHYIAFLLIVHVSWWVLVSSHTFNLNIKGSCGMHMFTVWPYDQHVSANPQAVQCCHHQGAWKVYGSNCCGHREDSSSVHPVSQRTNVGTWNLPSTWLHSSQAIERKIAVSRLKQGLSFLQ